MGIKVESMEPEVWDAVRAIARDEVTKSAASAVKPKSDKPVIAVISAPKPKGKGKGKGKGKAAAGVVLALLMLGSLSCSTPATAEEPLGLINPRNLDLTQTNAVWAFETTVTTTRIEADTASIAAPTLTGAIAVGDGTGAVTFDSGTYNSGFNDEDVVNVGQIDVDTIIADGAALAIGDGTETIAIDSSDWDVSATGTITNAEWQGTIVGVTYGGTGVADPTDHAVYVGSGSSAMDALVVGGANEVLCGAAAADPSFRALADADVPDGLTISGGTVDNSIVGGSTPAAGDFTVIDIDQTPTANAYTDAILSTWEAGADMAAGGSNGIYAVAKPIEDVQNAYSLRGRMDLRAATAAAAVNQLHAVDALINLNETYYYFADDNISVFGGAVHGNAAGGIGGTGTGALGGATLNVIFGMWGPTATADVDVETNFIKVISHAGTTVDYGLNIESSSDMNAGILLNSHSSNSPATMDVGLEMISASGKMVYGIDMSAASFTTGDIRVDGAQVITSGAWSLNSEVYAGVPGTLPVGSMAIGTGKVYIKLTNNGNEADWQYIDTTDD